MRIIYSIGIVALLSAIMVITPAMAQLTCSYDICVNETGWWRDGGEFNASGYPDPDDYIIENAVDHAVDGDTVFIQSGYYHHAGGHDGPLNIHTYLTLKGEGADVVTLDFEGIGGSGLGLYSGNSVIEGIKIVNSTYGIEVSVPDCIIRNCFFEGLSSEVGLQVGGENTTFDSNIVNGGVLVSFNTPVTCINNVILNTTKISYAMRFKGANSIVVNNTLINNTGGLGLYYENAINITVARNNIRSGGAGIKLYKTGSGNRIYLNNLVNNTENVKISSTTATQFWNSTEPIGYAYNGSTYTNYLGNYWSDYTGTDGDGDGIGDVPYVIPGSTDMDHRPLMAGFENYPAPAAGICGDVNEDGDVNVLDATKVKNRAGNPSYPLDDEWAADVNCDTFINVLDATKVKNRAGNPGYPLNCCP